jgi:hypothetical protein
MVWTTSFVLLAVAALVTGFALRTWRRRQRAAGRVRLYEMMRLRGVPQFQPRDHDTAAAERRCAACCSKQLCDELLRSGDSKGYRQFCPNALYLEWLHNNSLNFH